MAADVVQRAHSRATTTPVVVDRLVPPKLEACDIPPDGAKCPIGYRLGDCPEVVIPPTILVDAKEATGRSRELDKTIRLPHGHGERLIDDDMAPCSEGEFGVVGVGSGRSRDNDEFDQGIVKQASGIVELGRARVAVRHFVRASCHDRTQLER
jgi:hypothetical protein